MCAPKWGDPRRSCSPPPLRLLPGGETKTLGSNRESVLWRIGEEGAEEEREGDGEEWDRPRDVKAMLPISPSLSHRTTTSPLYYCHCYLVPHSARPGRAALQRYLPQVQMPGQSTGIQLQVDTHKASPMWMHDKLIPRNTIYAQAITAAWHVQWFRSPTVAANEYS